MMAPGILALVHSTFGHPGVARTTLLVQNKYCWPTLFKDVREYEFCVAAGKGKEPTVRE